MFTVRLIPSSRPAAVVAAGLVLTLAGCTTQTDTSPATTSATTPAHAASATPSEPPDQVLVSRTPLSTPATLHVHALAVDPAGRLLAATHEGLYRVGLAGGMSMVGSLRDDIMGLAVTSDGALVASGHPADDSDAADPLGLLRSTDGGTTWQTQALPGQADFHSIDARDSRVVATDGHALFVSSDAGRTWRAGTRQRLWSVAVDTRTIWTTGPTGLQRSDDDGDSLTPVPASPRLVTTTVAADTTPWGVDRNGTLWTWLGAQGWTPVAKVGAVDALAAADSQTAYAIAGTQLIRVRRAWASTQ